MMMNPAAVNLTAEPPGDEYELGPLTERCPDAPDDSTAPQAHRRYLYHAIRAGPQARRLGIHYDELTVVERLVCASPRTERPEQRATDAGLARGLK